MPAPPAGGSRSPPATVASASSLALSMASAAAIASSAAPAAGAGPGFGTVAAPLLPETRAVVLLSGGGGMTFGEEVVEGAGRQMLESGMSPEEAEKETESLRQFLYDLAKNPTPDKEWGSDGKLARNTYLWWAHAARLRLAISLRRVQAPMLILHGRDDRGTPYRSAELLLEELSFAGKSNVSFRPYQGGHTPPEEEILSALNWAVGQLTDPFSTINTD